MGRIQISIWQSTKARFSGTIYTSTQLLGKSPNERSEFGQYFLIKDLTVHNMSFPSNLRSIGNHSS